MRETDDPFPSSEEFAIYLNYVRKLGFEENPDYDFLRDLLTKVLRNSGEVEDGVYDWMLLNGGKGWQASAVRILPCSTRLLCLTISSSHRMRPNLPPRNTVATDHSIVLHKPHLLFPVIPQVLLQHSFETPPSERLLKPSPSPKTVLRPQQPLLVPPMSTYRLHHDEPATLASRTHCHRRPLNTLMLIRQPLSAQMTISEVPTALIPTAPLPSRALAMIALLVDTCGRRRCLARPQ